MNLHKTVGWSLTIRVNYDMVKTEEKDHENPKGGGDMDRERDLISRAQDGDVTAFEALIAEHQQNIFSIAYRMAKNRDDAEDMTQEILVKIFKNLKKFKGDSKFSTWIYRVATNTCLDEIQKRNRHQTYSLDKELETEAGSLVGEIRDETPTPEEHLEQKTVQMAVREAISRLGDDHKKVLILRDLQGMSYEEIGRILQCSEGTVKSRLSRARQTLKKIITQDRELFSDFFVK